MRVFVALAVGMLFAAAGCGATPEIRASTGAEAAAPGASGDPTWFQTGVLEEAFPCEEAVRVSVTNALGDVIVVSGAGAVVSATAELRGIGRDEEEARSRTKGVRLRGSLEDGFLLVAVEGGDKFTSVLLRVTIPPGRDLALDTSAGSASVQGVLARVSIAGMYGDIVVRDVRGPVRVHTETGSVTVGGVVEGATVYSNSGTVKMADVIGPVIARTMTGAVHLETASNDIIANTQGGDIDVEVTRPLEGSLEARTADGNIEVRIPAKSSCRVTTMTQYGDISSKLPLVEVTRNGVNIAGRLGDGKGTLLATTNRGNILLLPTEDSPGSPAS